MFYCAQSYADADIPDKAAEWYQKRADNLQGWSEERYMSYLHLGFAADNEHDEEKALYAFQMSAHVNPLRSECWYQLSRIHSWAGRYELAYTFCKRAEYNRVKDSFLFVDESIYHYWILYEIFINSFYTGRLEEAYQTFLKLIYRAPFSILENKPDVIKVMKNYFQEEAGAYKQSVKRYLENHNRQTLIQQLEL